jgi:hypothetical protein
MVAPAFFTPSTCFSEYLRLGGLRDRSIVVSPRQNPPHEDVFA